MSISKALFCSQKRRQKRATSINGKEYPLLSEAIAGGLFHPNCRHTATTWIEGASQMPKPLDKDKIREASKLEQKQRKLERQIRKLKRLEAGSEAEVTKQIYRKQLKNKQAELRGFIAEHDETLRREYWREKDRLYNNEK